MRYAMALTPICQMLFWISISGINHIRDMPLEQIVSRRCKAATR
jgi:hypothetical protein